MLSRRRVDFHIFAGHLVGGAVWDYVETFERLAQRVLSGEASSVPQPRGRELRLTLCEVSGRRVFIRAIHTSSERGVQLYNATDGREVLAPLAEGVSRSTATHALLDIEKRVAAIEYNHRGPKAADLEMLLSGLAGEIVGLGASLTFSPQPGAEFLAAIEEPLPIKLIRLTLTRPNYDWDDNFNALYNVLSDSDAGRGTMEVAAPRNDELNREAGIFSIVRGVVNGGVGGVKDVVIEFLEGSGQRIKKQLSKMVKKARVTVSTVDGTAEQSQMREMLSDVLDRSLLPGAPDEIVVEPDADTDVR